MNLDTGEVKPVESGSLLNRLEGRTGLVTLVLIGLFFALVVVFIGSIPVALLPFVVGGVLLLFFLKPSWGIIAVVLLQTINRFFSMLVGALPLFTVNRAVVLWLFLSVLLHRFVFGAIKKFHKHPQNRVALLFCLWYTISSLLAESAEHAAHFYPQMIGNFLFFYLVYQLIENEKQLRFVFLSFVGMLIGTGVISIIGHKITASPLFAMREMGAEGGGSMMRISGMSGMEPNNYAVVLVICIISLVVLLWWKDLQAWHRLTIIAFIIGFLFMLTRTFSRTGMLLFVLAGIYFVAIHHKRIGMRRIALGGLALTVILGLVASEQVIERFTSISKVKGMNLSEDRSISNRIGLTLMLPTLMARSPVFGVGPGNIPYLTSKAEFRRFVGRNQGGRGYRSHNQYVQLIGETGLIGFTIFAVLMGLCVRDLLISRRLAARFEGSFLWCLVESLILTLPLYFIGAATLEAASKKSFWFLVALPIITRRLLEEQTEGNDEESTVEAGTASE